MWFLADLAHIGVMNCLALVGSYKDVMFCALTGKGLNDAGLGHVNRWVIIYSSISSVKSELNV